MHNKCYIYSPYDAYTRCLIYSRVPANLSHRGHAHARAKKLEEKEYSVTNCGVGILAAGLAARVRGAARRRSVLGQNFNCPDLRPRGQFITGQCPPNASDLECHRLTFSCIGRCGIGVGSQLTPETNDIRLVRGFSLIAEDQSEICIEPGEPHA
jgi:hypothetical protein